MHIQRYFSGILILLSTLLGCTNSTTKTTEEVSTSTLTGSGVIIFDGHPALNGEKMNIWYYSPKENPVDLPILFVCHGMNRNADDYRDNWIDLADEHQILIVAPEFSEDLFPKSLAYNLGNMFDNDLNPIPEEKWSFSVVDPIFDFVVEEIDGEQTSYDMFGHSAGAQFAHRFLMFKKDTKVDRVVTANAGWYTMPDFEMVYPYGLKDTSLSLEDLTPMLERNIVVSLGDADTLRTSSLRQTPEADSQGMHRFERGKNYFRLANELAEENQIELGWSIQIIPGVGHDNAKMAPAAAEFLYGK